MGYSLEGYNDSIGLKDAIISSFSCDGNYRWSKVIGGGLTDSVTKLGADAQGNIYAVGQVAPITSSSELPVHFDTDFTLPYAPFDQNIYKQSLFIIKYNSDGIIQWLRMPQAADIGYDDSFNNNRVIDLQVDPDGTTNWFCQLAAGTYANGAFVVSSTGFFVLRYDAGGNFSSGTALDLHVTGGYSFSMTRNRATGDLYLAAEVGQGANYVGDVTINDELETKARVLAAFNSAGNFLWKRESASTDIYHVHTSHALTVDADNNIYFAASAGPIFIDQNTLVYDSFGGVSY